MEVKYSQIKVNLSKCDGNAFAIIGRVRQAMRHAHVPEDEIKAFSEEATSGDYDHMLQTCTKWVNVL